MKIEVVTEVDTGLDAAPWALYHEAFRYLNGRTVQRHLMYEDEFGGVMADKRIDKYLAYDDDGALVGLSTYTNDLDAWPLISAAYFELRWPQLYAEQRIWYCGFVAVPGHQSGVFADLVTAMYRRAEEGKGVIALDICRYNAEVHRLPRAITIMLTRVSAGQVRARWADEQRFYTYETAPA